MPDIVLALGFDLFFRPKLVEAARAVAVEVRFASPGDAPTGATGASRIVADVSVAGVLDAVLALRRERPHVPLLACYPHVQVALGEAVRAAGGAAVARGYFTSHLPQALDGTLDPAKDTGA